MYKHKRQAKNCSSWISSYIKWKSIVIFITCVYKFYDVLNDLCLSPET